MYKLKEAAKRGVAFAGAVGMLAGIGTTAFPAFVSADALNPLTERSLMLTSSSPGWSYTDGSNNESATLAPPGSGPNGKKTGETFSFRVSTASNIKAFTLQYCTEAAGNCILPGNGTVEANKESNLNIVHGSPVEDTNFNVYMGDATDQPMSAITPETGWSMVASRNATSGGTTENNFITLTSATGVTPAFDYQFYINLKATDSHYITNPGAGAFFVRMNTYSSDTVFDNTTRIDGGVTVANVMNESIHITTKVLETMSFSVGTNNRDNEPGVHGTCDNVYTPANTNLQLGESATEFSLSTEKSYDGTSYWRLSTNSSGGATVYYSGETLWNTVGDFIAPMPANELTSIRGTEQFGLAVDSTADTPDGAAPASSILPLVAEANYDEGAGLIDEADVNNNTAKFSFERASLTSPVPVATHDDAGIDCSTGKMRYIANIAANTPAGVYTTKINYIAAPKY